MRNYLMLIYFIAFLAACESTELDSEPGIASRRIAFAIPSQSSVTLYIENNYNTRVKTFYNHELLEAGSYTVAWDCLDNKGKPVPMGAYFVTLIADFGNEKYSKTIIIIVGKES